jgi:SAM-dependent methyltransferase
VSGARRTNTPTPMPSDRDVFSIFAALADPQRARMLRLVEREELAVHEVATALQLPQSTMSRQLKACLDAGLVTKRCEGTASLYRLWPDALAPEARRAWEIARESLGNAPVFDEDDRRLAEVLAAREADSKGFFGRVGGEWSDLRRGLFGERFASEALLALLPSAWTVADLGCGTGEIAAELAPFVAKVVAIDREPRMLDAARKRLRGVANVEVRAGDLHEIPAKRGEFDACVLSLVLHHMRSPGAVLASAQRVLAKGGVLLVIDMVRHARAEYRTTMGHEHLGFDERDLRALAEEASLSLESYRALRPAIDARGPGLFVARLVKA